MISTLPSILRDLLNALNFKKWNNIKQIASIHLKRKSARTQTNEERGGNGHGDDGGYTLMILSILMLLGYDPFRWVRAGQSRHCSALHWVITT